MCEKKLSLAVLGCALTAITQVQAAPFIYQGQLKHAGQPVTDTCDMNFSLWDGAGAGANQVGSTLVFSNNAIGAGSIDVVDGLFDATLDFGDGVFNDGPRWLQLDILCPGGTEEPYQTLEPRQPVRPAPVAHLAETTPWSGLTDVPAGFADGIDNGGDLTLPFSGTYEGQDSDAFGITQTGTGRAGRFGIDNANSYWEALVASSNASGPTFLCAKTGTGFAGRFQILNSNSTSSAVFASTDGSGAALSGDGGQNGYGVTGVANGSGNGVQGMQFGEGNGIYGQVGGTTGRAGYFRVVGDNHTGNAVEILTNGTSNSQAVFATHTGTGDCGVFEITNPTSQGEAVEGVTNGSGDAIQGINNGSGRGVYGRASSQGVYGLAVGLGVTHGVVGETEGASGNGVYGRALTSTGPNTGVMGQSLSAQGRGVYGWATSSTGVTTGVVGRSDSTTGRGVYGESSAQSGEGFGVFGRSQGVLGVGVRGEGTHGVSGEGTVGVYGRGTGQNGVGGYFVQGSGDVALRTNGDAEINGWARVSAVQILGGADLAERFSFTEAAEPGMVVAIDPTEPGKLRVSKEAYNRRVAGIISGANQLNAGIVLGEEPVPGAVEHAVALSGRVWVDCDATANGVQIGDFLTTAQRPGYAMAASDPAKAQGAIIGKAMTALAQGETGQVLVLVNLQ